MNHPLAVRLFSAIFSSFDFYIKIPDRMAEDIFLN